MQLSIIIVNYNVKHYLELCLDSVFAAIKNIEAEVIVIDNASVDGSVAMIKNKFSTVHCISNDINLGFSKANNQGVRKAQGEFICILNPDTVVAEDTFENVYAFAKTKNNLGAIGVRLIDGSGKYLPESKRNLPTPKISLSKMLGDASTYYANHLAESEKGKVEVLVGAFMFVKKCIYQEVGGLDERYFMYGEDIDFSYTLSQAGYDNYYLGDCAIIHFKGESTVKDKKYRERFYGAMRLFYEKHLSKSKFEKALVQAGLEGVKLKSSLSNSDKNHSVTNGTTIPKEYHLITQNETLKETVETKIDVPLEIYEKITSVKASSEVIFDAATMSYKEIISSFMNYVHHKATFKIIPKNSTFAVGSNSSKGRGEVIKFETQ